MTTDELLRLIGNREDNFVERKSEGVKTAELRQTIGAFANSVPEGRAAVLFIGLHDKSGETLGVENPEALQMRVRDVCREDCYPPVDYRSEVLTVGGKAIVAVVVPFSREKPHFTGPAFIRLGSVSQKASPQQYEHLILNRVDTAREILKHQNEIFTVLGVGYRLGSNRHLPDAHYREMRECRLHACSGLVVTLDDISAGNRFSEPLKRVEFTFDHERNNRPMLVVTFTKA